MCSPPPADPRTNIVTNEIETTTSSRLVRRNSEKKVQFADHLGFQLSNKQKFLNNDAPILCVKPPETLKRQIITNLLLTSPQTRRRVEQAKCKVTSIQVEIPLVKGTILVDNVEFEKRVLVRYSTDSWKTTIQVQSQWKCSNSERSSDEFSFEISLQESAFEVIGVVVEFAIQFECVRSQKVYWDNNLGNNYIVETRFILPPKDEVQTKVVQR